MHTKMLSVCLLLESRSAWEFLIEYLCKSNDSGLKKINALIGLCKGSGINTWILGV